MSDELRTSWTTDETGLPCHECSPDSAPDNEREADCVPDSTPDSEQNTGCAPDSTLDSERETGCAPDHTSDSPADRARPLCGPADRPNMDRLADSGIFRHGYGLIPKYAMQDRKLSLTAKSIYAYLCSLCGGGETAFPSVETIRAALNLGRDAYYQHRKQLEEAGYITVQRRHRGRAFTSNLYTLNANPRRFQREAEGAWENRIFAAVRFHGLRGAGYGVLPRAVMTDPRLDAKAKALYAYFASFTGAGTCAFPSLDRLLRDLGVSRPAYYKYLNQLKEAGYLAAVQRREGNRFAVNEYYLLDGTEPGPPDGEACTVPVGTASPCTKNPDIMEPDANFPYTKNPDIINPDAIKPDTENPDTTNNRSLTNNKNYTINNLSDNPPTAQPGEEDRMEQKVEDEDGGTRGEEREHTAVQPAEFPESTNKTLKKSRKKKISEDLREYPESKHPFQIERQKSCQHGPEARRQEQTDHRTESAVQRQEREQAAGCAREGQRSEEIKDNFIRELRQAFDYKDLPFRCPEFSMSLIDNLITLLASAVCDGTGPTVRIGRQEVSREEARKRFLSLTGEHLQYVLRCVREQGGQVRNLRAYYLTAFWNAPDTMELYSQSRALWEGGPQMGGGPGDGSESGPRNGGWQGGWEGRQESSRQGRQSGGSWQNSAYSRQRGSRWGGARHPWRAETEEREMTDWDWADNKYLFTKEELEEGARRLAELQAAELRTRNEK